MLGAAVQKNKVAQQQNLTRTLNQQIFSSSPPTPATKGADATSARVGSHGGQPLHPVSPNKIMSRQKLVGQVMHNNNPLKRTSSSISTGSNGSLGSRKFSSQGRQHAVPTTLPRTSSILNDLHADPVWDDFPDDADVFLDEQVPEALPAKTLNTSVSYPTLPSFEPIYPQGEPEYPKLPDIQPKSPTNRKLENSSSALPWSSSPLEHKRPGEAIDFKRPAPMAASRGTAACVVETIDLEAEEPQQPPAKRRTLPWKEKPAQATYDDPENESKRMRRPKQERPETKTATPTAKNEPYLWNQTASAVKAEQKKLRDAAAVKNKSCETEGEDSGEGAGMRKVKTNRKAVPKVFLSDEQKEVLNLVVDGKKSVFFTGSAGTGKSVLMREIIESLKKRHKNESDRVAVTASTGLAACNIGGNTLHSFAGIGLGKETVEQLCKKIKRNQKAVQRWQRTKVLVIDEISMIDGALFDKLEAIARSLRRKAQPFGGIQLVITGDFFQLPPVGDNKNPAKFSFDASTWNTCIDHTIGLTHVFRQRDPVFAGMLNEMRLGKLSRQSITAFQKLARPLVTKELEAVEATELFSTRSEVEGANQMRLKRLGGTSVELAAQDGGTIADLEQRNKLLSNCMAPQMISLKKGAQVMLIKNIDDTLVNGSIGKIVAFMDEKTFDYYDEHEEEFVSTHPSTDADPEKSGSRASIKGFMNPGAGNVGQKWPVVRFQIADGTSRDLLCQRETWKIEQPNGEVLASRSQVPLILAWALSIHKAQGQTLEKVKVDLRRVFEKGQAYVALSRATTQEGLQVMGFNASKVQAHDRVRKFYDSLYGVDTITGTGPSLAPPTNKDRVKTDMYETDFPFGADEEALMRQLPA